MLVRKMNETKEKERNEVRRSIRRNKKVQKIHKMI
jgi:hypothetical protein